ncbi:hypothetical protein [Salinimonas sediminis]|uniref:Uncharacterized protein n=1 Tax=Salinimonas sediminis TaxID=2303538 RepID=A0A346NLE9_9ALTE|nr:hypothetical protein [Salinimonas sediminis]AXR06356.1 hypothetical protein D0Y50_08240 [Salinimonas sediminis]
MLLLLFLLLFYMIKLLVDVIRLVSRKETSIHELKFFFITLAVVSAGAYFFIAIIDSKEQMIAGLREVEAEQVYNFQSLNGLMGGMPAILSRPI